MRVPARWHGRFLPALSLIALGGMLGRVTYVVWMQHRPLPGDGLHYHLAALQLVDGLGFINPVVRLFSGETVPDAVHPPAWTIVLAGPSGLGLRSNLAHQLVACAIGTATIIMTGVAGRVAFGRRTGLLAASLVAVYPNVWVYERELLAEPLAMLGVATTIWLAYRFHAAPGTALAAALGVAVGALAMTRSELIAVAGFLVAPLILFSAKAIWRRRLSWLAMATAACLIVIAPWAIYNSTRFERPVLLSVGLGGTMLQGNCPPTYGGERLGYYEFGCIGYVRYASADPSVADAQYRRVALDFMRDNRSRVPVTVVARLGRAFGAFRPFQQMQLERERGTDLWVIRFGFFAYWALLPLALTGVIVARRRKVPIYPLLAFPATVILAVALTIGAIRYRAPAEIPLVLLAALALDAVIETWRHRRGRPRSGDRTTFGREQGSTPDDFGDMLGRERQASIHLSVCSRTFAR